MRPALASNGHGGRRSSLSQNMLGVGWVGCCVYPKGSFYDYNSTARLRRVHATLQARFGYRPALAYSFFSAYALTPFFRIGKRISVLRRFLDFLEKNWLVVIYLRDAR